MTTPRIRLLLVSVLLVLVAGILADVTSTGPSSRAPVTITLYRFFGGCSDEYAGVIDVTQAIGECGVLQVLTNRFNLEHDGKVFVRTQTAEWSGYYDRLSAAYAARRPPDIAVMNASVLPNFAARGLVRPLSDDLAAANVPLNDLLDSARERATFEGELYGLPLDLHGLLWHVNVDILRGAGLVDSNGNPVLPTSPDMLMRHAEQVRRSTGARYFAIPSQTDPMPTWLFQSWVWQQDAALLATGPFGPTVETDAARRALELLLSLYEHGYADPGHDYAGAEQAFLNGEAAVLINGTWVVDSYSAEAARGRTRLRHYAAYALPRIFGVPAAWTDSHVWVLPRAADEEPRRHAAAIAFLKYLFEQSAAWARTGHLPVRSSVLASSAFADLPHRSHYRSTALMARALAGVQNQRAIEAVLIQHINATWLAGQSPAESLRGAQRDLVRVFARIPANASMR